MPKDSEPLFSSFFPGLLEQHPVLHGLLAMAALFILALLVMILTRKVLLRVVAAFTAKSPSRWDDIMFEQGVFSNMSWFIPLLVIQEGLQWATNLPDRLTVLLARVIASLMGWVFVISLSAFLNSLNEIHNVREADGKSKRPIKSYIQVGKIILYTMGVIGIVATLLGKSPWYLLSGIGAMSAVLLLIFRDTILSLVAGIQLTSNDLVRLGDWIEMPMFNADGDVVDIALNTIKVKNWDNTVTVIPAHKFLENSFKNWRNMHELGGRRICRSIYLDISTISFLDDEQISRLEHITLLKEYLAGKRKELAEYNQAVAAGESIANTRRLTNIGTLRAYMIAYLRNHPKIHQEMTLLVRQMEATPSGVPLQVYAFTNNTAWINYEGVQGDVFDHFMAMVPEFGLRVFQNPSGADFKSIAPVSQNGFKLESSVGKPPSMRSDALSTTAEEGSDN